MSELNENVEVTIDDATVVTVPLVTNFTATNAAPTAKYVGDALAQKVDSDGIMEAVTITFDGIESDNQGILLVSAEDIPLTDGTTINTSTGEGSIKYQLDALGAKTASDINYATGKTIKTKIDEVETAIGTAQATTEAKLYGDQIPMGSSDATKINAAIGSVDTRLQTVEGKYLKKETQELTDTEKGYVRANIGIANVTPFVINKDLAASAVTIASGDTNSDIYIAVPEIAGYIPAGVVGRRLSGSGSSACNISRLNLVENDETGDVQVRAGLRNMGSSSATATIYVDVLYIRATFLAVATPAQQNTEST